MGISSIRVIRGQKPVADRLSVHPLISVLEDAMRAALHLLEAEGQISPGHAGAKRQGLGSGTAPLRWALLAITEKARFRCILREN